MSEASRKDIHVVIGANFGDEGKGLTTDYLSLCYGYENPIVVRFNGGAQAGHTVVTPEGKRHVFSHVGSGALQDVPTYLSDDFIVDPIAYFNEMNDLLSLSIVPKVYIDSQSKLTTPYDFMLNMALEKIRGNNKHGSCGYGINEVMQRHLQDDERFHTQTSLIHDIPALKEKMALIRNEWLPKRIAELGFDVNRVLQYIDGSDFVIEDFSKWCTMLSQHFTVELVDEFPDEYETIICEGAQGLLLDQDNKQFFPNVTHSHTGMTNVVKFAKKYNGEIASITYVTRAYLTRHGAGVLPHEGIEPGIHVLTDDTNKFNHHQEHFRYAPLDVDLLFQSISNDLDTNMQHTNSAEVNLMVTCVDHLHSTFRIVNEGKLDEQASISKLLGVLSKNPIFSSILYSTSNTHENIRAIELK